MSWTGHKFDSAVTEVLYDLMDWWSGEQTGDGDSPTGWFTQPLQITAAELNPDTIEGDLSFALQALRESHEIADAEMDEIITAIVGVHILGGNSQGFVYSVGHPDLATAQDAYDEAEAAYGVWLTQCMDCGAPTYSDNDLQDDKAYLYFELGQCTVDPTHAGCER